MGPFTFFAAAWGDRVNGNSRLKKRCLVVGYLWSSRQKSKAKCLVKANHFGLGNPKIFGKQWGWCELDGHIMIVWTSSYHSNRGNLSMQFLLNLGNIAIFSAWPMGSAWGCKKRERARETGNEATARDAPPDCLTNRPAALRTNQRKKNSSCLNIMGRRCNVVTY